MKKDGYLVRVSDTALEGMILAAAEAYYLGDGRKSEKSKLETYGYLWGYIKENDDHDVYYIDKIGISVSATRECDWVRPNPAALRLKDNIISRLSPHLTLIGDFHSHPYNDLKDVYSRKDNGYSFSDGDFEHFTENDYLWKTSRNRPLMAVMSICELKRVHDNDGGEWIRQNVWQFDLGEFRFWLNVSVGYVIEGKRKYTGNKYSKTTLDLNARFFNEKSGRVTE